MAALALAATPVPAGAAEPSALGQTGLVHVPDARVAPDGTLRFGVSHSDPYFVFWGSATLFPRLEVSGRYTRIDGLPGFAGAPELGAYRDKAFDAKLIALYESGWWPAVAFGAQDYVGTRRFAAEYVALGKRWGAFDFTAGYGRERLDGAFGGVRYTPTPGSRWRLMVEYDATDYRHDFGAAQSGAERREGGATYALGYHAHGWGATLGYQRGEVAGNIYVSLPLMAPEFVPKLHEPAPYTAVTPRAVGREWASDPRYPRLLARALADQGFTDIRLRWREPMLELSVSHERIALASRAVGRAARTALRLGPADMRTLRIIYSEREQPIVTYTFTDPAVLERYFAGRASRAALEARSDVAYASSATARELRHAHPWALDPVRDVAEPVPYPHDRFLAFPSRPRRGEWRLYPFNARLFFNDPGAPLRYDTFASAAYRRRLGPGWMLAGSARLTLAENVSDIRQPSTSLLPHVRSDIGEYRRHGDRLRLNALLAHRYGTPRERVYGRWSIGYYEEMYAGSGAQVLYLPARGDWAVDLAVDALRQRAPGEAFGFRDYTVVTAIASVHRRWPCTGVTFTARIGRFLAKDEGVRFEFKRRFRSGVELGAWYSWTNEKDVTSPGTPDNPYRDKGLFVSIPLNWLLTRDTRERATLALADYTRDVGQLVASPDDLYRLLERPLMLDSGEHDALTDFAR